MIKRVYFFASRVDILLALEELGKRFPISYESDYVSSKTQRTSWEIASTLPDLGQATGDQHLTGNAFMLTLHDGSSQASTHIIFRPGGEWSDGSYVAGSFTTDSNAILRSKFFEQL